MTLAQLNALAPADQKILVGWQGMTQTLDRGNPLELHAYGAYLVAKIMAVSEDILEADLLAQPVKEA